MIDFFDIDLRFVEMAQQDARAIDFNFRVFGEALTIRKYLLDLDGNPCGADECSGLWYEDFMDCGDTFLNTLRFSIEAMTGYAVPVKVA